MTDCLRDIAARLVDVLNNASTRPRGLAYIKYPTRELKLHTLPNGDVEATLSKCGWEYKHRGSKPKTPPVVDLNYTAALLTQALAPDYRLVSIEDVGTAIKIIIRRKESCFYSVYF